VYAFLHRWTILKILLAAVEAALVRQIHNLTLRQRQAEILVQIIQPRPIVPLENRIPQGKTQLLQFGNVSAVDEAN
jgi:hypothetical protein